MFRAAANYRTLLSLWDRRASVCCFSPRCDRSFFVVGRVLLLPFQAFFSSHEGKRIKIPRHQISVGFSRSSGAGGQNVNKVNTKVELRFTVSDAEWIPTDIKERFVKANKNKINKEGEFVLTSERERTQTANLNDAFDKLQELIDEASVEPKERIATEVPEYAHQKRLEEKTHRKDIKRARKVNMNDLW